MALETSTEVRRAALVGTRALVAEERFDALLAMLVATNVLSEEQVRAMARRLSERLTAHANGELESEWQVHPGELRIEAARLAARAAIPPTPRGQA